MRLRLALVTTPIAGPIAGLVAGLVGAVVVGASLSAAVAQPASAPVLPDAPAPWSDGWLLGFTTTYLDDDDARRSALERSLTNPDNLYARMRIAAYAKPDAGWDLLPTWNPRAALVDAAVVDAIRQGAAPHVSAETAPLWDGARPQTMPQWVALGRRVFFTYPLRPEPAAEHAIADDARAREIGLHRDDGTYPGLVVFRDIDGDDKVGITCALCHSSVEGGALVIGRARRDLDYGAMRLAWHRDTGEPVDARLGSRMASWGPGRADITEDDDADPVAIPDLWRLRDLRYLTQAATIVHDRHDGHATPLALAIRQETQYIHANGERTRPPRELAWALAMFLYSLDASAVPSDAPLAQLDRGRALFDAHCVSCHGDGGHSGEAVTARRVGTDPALANGTSRGTGLYRPAPLVAVATAGPHLHDGTIATLDDLLDPTRFDAAFDRGVRAPGPVPGHAYGTSLSAADRDALIAWLRTL